MGVKERRERERFGTRPTPLELAPDLEAVGAVRRADRPGGGRATDDMEGKVMMMWSLFHGFFAPPVRGRIPMETRDRVRALETQAVDSLLIAWRAGRD